MMFASYSTGFAGSTLGRISGYVFVPFERGINTVGGWLRSRADSLEDLADAQAKNEELQSQVDELTLENSRLMQNQYRLEELEELYALDQTYSEYNKVAALSLIHIYGEPPRHYSGCHLWKTGGRHCVLPGNSGGRSGGQLCDSGALGHAGL